MTEATGRRAAEPHALFALFALEASAALPTAVVLLPFSVSSDSNGSAPHPHLAGVTRDIAGRRKNLARMNLLETSMPWRRHSLFITKTKAYGELAPDITLANGAFERRTGHVREEALRRSSRTAELASTMQATLRDTPSAASSEGKA